MLALRHRGWEARALPATGDRVSRTRSAALWTRGPALHGDACVAGRQLTGADAEFSTCGCRVTTAPAGG